LARLAKPGGQLVQLREPAALLYVPATQLRQVVAQLAMNLPGGHGMPLTTAPPILSHEQSLSCAQHAAEQLEQRLYVKPAGQDIAIPDGSHNCATRTRSLNNNRRRRKCIAQLVVSVCVRPPPSSGGGST
jgi:hypothetical protein